MTDFRMTDDWFYLADMNNPNTVQTVRAIFTVIQFEAQAAARDPNTLGAWPAAEKLGYEQDHFAWEFFAMVYLNTWEHNNTSAQKTPRDDFQLWINRILEQHLGE